MQTDVVVTGNKITGTLKKLTTGPLPDYWGEGYFIALDFTNIPDGATVLVGLDPTQGSGYLPLDEDHNGVFKITDKDAQTFNVITEKGGERVSKTFYLGDLELE